VPVAAAGYGGARRERLFELWPEALEALDLDQLLIEGDRLVVESEQGRLVADVLLGISSGLLSADQFALADGGRDPVIRPVALLRRGVHATATNAQLLAMSGKRNPCPGKLGVVEQGALADLLLVDGDPLENLKLIAEPAKNFVVIMKDGKIYKNLLH
jgi:hypothetical protein